MVWGLIIGLILTILPVTELRAGLPFVLDYALRKGFNIFPFFILVLILNILVIFLIFGFFDLLHEGFLRFGWYEGLFNRKIEKIRKKIDRVENRRGVWAYLTLMLFVSVPLPGTGAWTGALIAWLLGMNRLRSFVAIAGGVIIAGVLILLGSLGLFSFLY